MLEQMEFMWLPTSLAAQNAGYNKSALKDGDKMRPVYAPSSDFDAVAFKLEGDLTFFRTTERGAVENLTRKMEKLRQGPISKLLNTAPMATSAQSFFSPSAATTAASGFGHNKSSGGGSRRGSTGSRGSTPGLNTTNGFGATSSSAFGSTGGMTPMRRKKQVRPGSSSATSFFKPQSATEKELAIMKKQIQGFCGGNC